MTPSQTPPEQKEQRIAAIERDLADGYEGIGSEEVRWLLAELRRLESDKQRMDFLESFEGGVETYYTLGGSRISPHSQTLRATLDTLRNSNSRTALEPSPVERAGQ